MKELSIEEKAKRYDEAIKKAKDMLSYKEVRKEDIEYLFPEFKEKENDDEKKIKEEICKLLWDNVPYEEAQRYINYICRKQVSTNSEEDEEMKETCIFYLNKQKCYVNNVSCIEKCIDWLEKQGDDKVEQKFKIGDWVVFNNKHQSIYQVEKIEDGYYILRHTHGGTFRVCVLHDESLRPWTIQDAKDGDVLAVERDKTPFIFKGFDKFHPGCPVAYCGIDDSGIFVNSDDGWWTDEKVEPATKEQRDLLFEKMKESGYEWDAEKKELKKIEQRSVEKIEPKFKVGNWYQCTKDFFGKGVTFDKNTAYYCAKEGCLQCEYGCHIAIVKDLYDNFKLWSIQDAKDGDVLACNEEILLFKSYSVQGRISLYCWYNGQTNNFHSKEVVDTLMTTRNKICPATKEQRDTLIKAMTDARYTFDFEKKELKKIIDEKQIKKNLQDNSFRRMFEQKPAWSEEDEMIALSIEQVMNCASLLNIVPEKIDKIRTWLKSLKERMKGE